MQIRVEPEQLEEISTQLKGEGDKFEECINAMDGLIKRIPEAWAGQAAEAFQGQFEELKPSFQQVRELIEDIGVQINEVIQAVQNMDEEIASKMK